MFLHGNSIQFLRSQSWANNSKYLPLTYNYRKRAPKIRVDRKKNF